MKTAINVFFFCLLFVVWKWSCVMFYNECFYMFYVQICLCWVIYQSKHSKSNENQNQSINQYNIIILKTNQIYGETVCLNCIEEWYSNNCTLFIIHKYGQIISFILSACLLLCLLIGFPSHFVSLCLHLSVFVCVLC